MTTTVIFHLLLVAGVVLMALMAAVPVLVETAAEGRTAPSTRAAETRTAPAAGVLVPGANRARNGAATPAAGVRAPGTNRARRGASPAANPTLHLPRAA